MISLFRDVGSGCVDLRRDCGCFQPVSLASRFTNRRSRRRQLGEHQFNLGSDLSCGGFRDRSKVSSHCTRGLRDKQRFLFVSDRSCFNRGLEWLFMPGNRASLLGNREDSLLDKAMPVSSLIREGAWSTVGHASISTEASVRILASCSCSCCFTRALQAFRLSLYRSVCVRT